MWPKDTLAAKNAFYGDPRGKNGPSVKWESENLILIKPPFQMYYAKKPVQAIRVHKKIAKAVLAAFDEIWEKCGRDQKKADATGVTDYAGCYNYRRIAGSGNMSNHSWGCALDLSPETNGFNMKGTLSKIVVEAFKRQGARWGGDYKGRTDPMHFEFVS